MNVFISIELTPRCDGCAKDLSAVVKCRRLKLVDGPPCLERVAPSVTSVLVSEPAVHVVVVAGGQHDLLILVQLLDSLELTDKAPVHDNIIVLVGLIVGLLVAPVHTDLVLVKLPEESATLVLMVGHKAVVVPCCNVVVLHELIDVRVLRIAITYDLIAAQVDHVVREGVIQVLEDTHHELISLIV